MIRRLSVENLCFFFGLSIQIMQIHAQMNKTRLRPSWASGTTLVLTEFFSCVFNSAFLALLDFVSRATCTVMAQASVVRPSVVSKPRFLRNRCIDPGQILWVAASSPYLQKLVFCFFKTFNFPIFTIFFFIFVNMGTYGSKNFKTLLRQFSSDLSQTLS